ncbi:MAG: hypothetical protein GXP08_02300 [Gammaproteobacteria bacterium]|nr:hypothetical protein [Gammaproteobacteria bacterium]
MKKALNTLCLFICFYAGSCFSDVLVLSHKLKIDYPKANLISHTQDSLIVKYDNWYFVHSVVDPKSIYSNIDLTGTENKFLRSIFDKNIRAELPGWLAALSNDQAKEFGVTINNVKHNKIGNADLLSVYDKDRSTAYTYIFDELTIHNIVVFGSEENYTTLINNIKER